MLTCHDSGEVTDIHISGILDEPVNIRRLTKSEASDLFVPKLKYYFERKSLNSFVIKNNITPQHFESFIDVMGEPIADSADSSKLGEYLEILSRVVYEELGGDPFFFNTVDEFHSLHNISQALRTM